MRKAIGFAFLVIFTAAITSVAGAQTTTRVKTSKEQTPTWTGRGTMYGFMTCDKIRAQGSKVTEDDIKKCIAGGGKYTFGGNNVNTDGPVQAKLAPFAGKFVAVTVTMTSARYGTGPTSDVAVDGLYSGGNRPATRDLMYQVASVAIDPTPDPSEGAPNAGGRGGGRAAPAE